MYMLLIAIVGVLSMVLEPATAQAPTGNRRWRFPDRLTLANGEGNGNPTRPVSFLNDTLWPQFDLNKPFFITARLNVADQRFWRAAISIESPHASSALFRIALPPNQMRFNVAWMSNAQTRGGSIDTTAVAPGPNTEFQFALVKDSSSISISVNGVKQWSAPFNGQIFNPQNKSIVLGRTMLEGNSLRSQWNGVIRDVLLREGSP